MDIKELVRSLSDPHSENMKAWTGGLGQLERLLENTCGGRGPESAGSDMFPGFPSTSSSQAVPSPAPLNPGGQNPNPWFHQSPFSMGGDMHPPAPSSGSPYWLPHPQYPAATSEPHQPRYQGGNDLYPGSAAPWWLGASGTGLPSSQYFPGPPTGRGDHVPFQPSPPSPQKGGGYLQHSLAGPPANQQHPLAGPPTNQSHLQPPEQPAPMGLHQRTLPSSSPLLGTGMGLSGQTAFRGQEAGSAGPMVSQGAPPQQQHFGQEQGRYEAPPPQAPQAGFRAEGGAWPPQEAPPSAKRPKAEEEPKPEEKASSSGTSNEGTPRKKGRRKRDEAKKKKHEVPLDPKKGLQRKNIRDIKNEMELDEVTLNAQKEEQERMKRLQEARLRALQQQGSHLGPIALGSSSSSSSSDSSSDEADDSSDDDVDVPPLPPGDVIDISSSDEGKLPQEEEDDDVVMVVSDEGEEEEKAEELGGDGSHVNDALNQPDPLGRVLVNVGHPPEDPDVFLAPQLAPLVKPHQIGGIRFLFDNVVESVGRFDTSSGFGCILAHSMGLGKTLQVVSFVDVLLRHTGAKKVLCITPINTIQNWLAEFDKWVPAPEVAPTSVRPRSYHVYLLNDMYRSTPARADLILDWHNKGGVLLMGYEMYRMLALKKVSRPSKRRRRKEEPEDDSRHSQLLQDVYQALVNPGPDLVICDEGHRIKNCNASTSAALKSIRTKRRIVLTGYPLQNNLLEYWCMVDFVRPSYLGTRSEFCNMFERPIQNGQCLDSTPKDRQLMRFRAHVLHSLLQGFVQRRGHAVLRDALPRKEEHVLLIRMTPIQRTLYREFVKEFLHNYRATNPLKFFAVCCKVWNHPDILFHLVQDKKSEGALDIDLDIDLLAPPGSKDPMGTRGTGQPGVDPSDNPYPFAAETSGMCARAPKYPPEPAAFREKSDNNISYEWAYPLLEQYQPDQLENSHKFLVLMTILEQTLGVGDKLLVFSQSLSTLDLVERFLGQREVPLRPGLPHGDKWARGRNYFRLDGSTSAQEREKLINEYNANAGVSLFLLSTRAGCLGINLTGANRIVVLDASWNPCHDAQAVCRIYRYGQAKPCHIYRLVCDNCLEKRIYDRQVNKQGMSDRVVDEMNPEANLTWKDVSTLVQDNEDDPPVQDLSASAGGYSDSVLRTLSVEYSQCLTKEPFEHESLLLDRKDLKLTKFEKRLAKQSYELEKRATLHGGRSYVHSAAYTNGYQGWQNRQQGNVTFVGPAQTTPSPLQPASNGDMPIWGSPNVMQSLLRQGMTVQRMRVPAKVTIPLNNSADPPVEIPPGTEILVMKTPKGVYLRIPDGRIIAVRIPGIGEAGPQSSEGTSAGAAAHSGNKQSFGIVQPSLQCGGRVQLSGAAGAACQSRAAPEVINLDDDSDLPDEDSSEEEGAPPPANNGAAAKTPSPPLVQEGPLAV